MFQKFEKITSKCQFHIHAVSFIRIVSKIRKITSKCQFHIHAVSFIRNVKFHLKGLARFHFWKKNNRKDHLRFAKLHRNKKLSYWKKVLWSDEVGCVNLYFMCKKYVSNSSRKFWEGGLLGENEGYWRFFSQCRVYQNYILMCKKFYFHKILGRNWTLPF